MKHIEVAKVQYKAVGGVTEGIDTVDKSSFVIRSCLLGYLTSNSPWGYKTSARASLSFDRSAKRQRVQNQPATTFTAAASLQS